MADRSKFEEMLELLINENREAAEELFHELVVTKSREIYESLLEDEEEVDESDDEDLDESDDEDLDESDDEDLDESDDEELDEYFDLDEFEVEADDDMIGGDETDDMMGDLEPDDGMDDMGGMDDMEGDEGDVDSRLDDIEDAIEDLKAEFEAMMAGDDMGDDDMGDDDMGDDDMGDDEMEFGGDDDDEGEEDEDEDDEESKESFTYEAKKSYKKDEKKVKKTAGEEMREYVEKIGGDRYEKFGKMGDNGVQTKSPVAGKNDMGGTAQNILRGGSENGVEANKGKLQGSALNAQSPKDMSTKNVNVAGGKAGVKHLKTQNGGGLDKNSILKKDTSDKGAKSPINGVKTRAK